MAYTPFTFGIFNASAPSLTDGEIQPVQLDVNGNLKVAIQGSIPASLSGSIPAGTNFIGHVDVDNLIPIVQYADNSVSGATPTGNLSSGWDVAGSKIRALTVDANSNLNVCVATSLLTDPAEGLIGATLPVKALQVGASDGVHLQTLLVDGSGNLKVVSAGGGGGSVTQGTSPWVVSGTVTAAQGTASSLKAEVVFPTAQPVTLTSTTVTGTVAVTQSTSPWVVSNGGTFAVQAAATLAAETTKVIGTINVAASQTIAVTNTGTFAVQSASTLATETTKTIGTVRCQGNVGGVFDAATAATVPANAVQVGTRGTTTNPTAVTAGQLVAPMSDKLGRQAVVLNHVRDLVVCTPTTISSTSSPTEIMAAGAASTFMDIVSLVITQSSGTASTATLTDGTASYIFDLAATAGTGLSIQFPTPLKNTTTAHNWTLALSSSAITVHITCIAVTNL